MKDVITNKQGHCPYCDSDDVDYDNSELFEDVADRYYTCNDCSDSFTESYSLVYKETIGDRQIEE